MGLGWSARGVRGTADDLYMMPRGYSASLYAGFIVLHLVVIGAGIAAVRSARAGGV